VWPKSFDKRKLESEKLSVLALVGCFSDLIIPGCAGKNLNVRFSFDSPNERIALFSAFWTEVYESNEGI